MKRLLTLLFAMAAVAMLSAPAFAAISTSPHDFSGGATPYGMCGTCHVPHAAAGGKRLWRVAPSGNSGSWATSNVGQLCYGCHGSALYLLGGVKVPNATAAGGVVEDIWASTAGPFAANSHARSMTVLNTNLAGPAGPITGKPYTASAGSIECTSCHNVHFDGAFASASVKRPFLRTSASKMSNFCAECHTDRLDDNLTGSANVSGNHPVNINYAPISGNAYLAVPPASLTTTVGLHSWSLGGKFQTSAGVPAASTDYAGIVAGTGSASVQIGCQSCHAVHNNDNFTTNGVDQALHLLAIDNAVGTTAALCEGCHGNPTGNTARANSGARMEVGQTAGDHPIDIPVVAPGPTIDRWYVTAGDTTRSERNAANGGAVGGFWPNPLNGSAQHVVICTSCHSAHKGRVTTGSGRKLTRTGWANSGTVGWCSACHSDPSPAGHHSHSGNTPVPAGANNAGYTSLLGCTDCHGGNSGGISDPGSGSLAHNGFVFNANFAGPGVNNASQLCNYCHLAAASATPAQYGTGNGGVDPVGEVIVGNPNIANNAKGIPNAHLTSDGLDTGAVAGMKSHYLGTIHAVAGYVNVKTTNWFTNGTGFSKYGAATDTHGRVADTTGTVVVCESCHSVLHNVGAQSGATKSSGYVANLLLQDYKDDNDGGSNTVGGNGLTARNTGSGFCVACHNSTSAVTGGTYVDAAGPVPDSDIQDKHKVPAGTHPMSTWSITRAQDAGRVPSTLITGAGSYADANIGGANLPYPTGTNVMDCDSCHMPHMAPANSTYNQTQAQGGTSVPVILQSQTNPNEWADFCQKCHTEGAI